MSNPLACLKMPYNRFSKLSSLYFYSAAEGNTPVSVWWGFLHQNELEMWISSCFLIKTFVICERKP